jgi:hypothetical protein
MQVAGCVLDVTVDPRSRRRPPSDADARGREGCLDSRPMTLFARLLLIAAALFPLSGSPQLSDPRLSDDDEPRVLVIGDSFIRQSFGRGLERELSDAGFAVLRRGKSSSGLARPDFFDWWSEGARLVAAHDPAVIIVMMGGNDGQDLLNRNRRGRVRWGDREWEERYAARVESFLNALDAGARTVLWVELPPMRGRRFEKKVQYIRGIQREMVSRVPSARYVRTGDLLRDSAGRLLRTFSRSGATSYAVHETDGVHLTTDAGWAFAQRVALRILPEMERNELPDDRGPSAGGRSRMTFATSRPAL